MGLKIMASRSPWMALLLYQNSLKSTKQFKSYSGETQTDWWGDKLLFIFGA
jgi:hypothetical protein